MSLRKSRNEHNPLNINAQIGMFGGKNDFPLANSSIPRTLGFSNLKKSGKFRIR
jgi:hypothetical protein